MTLLIVLAMVAAVGLLLELTRPLLDRFLARLHREEPLRDTIRQTQADVAEATKRAETLAVAAKAVRQDVARAKQAQADLEQEFEDRKKVQPVLVFSIGTPADQAESMTRCFRAPVTKTLRSEAEVNQTQIWSRTCFIEVCCYSAAEAKLEAYLQFPIASGYVIGPFADKAASLPVALAAPGEAA